MERRLNSLALLCRNIYGLIYSRRVSVKVWQSLIVSSIKSGINTRHTQALVLSQTWHIPIRAFAY